MSVLKRKREKIILVFSNVNPEFQCDYIFQTAKELKRRFPVFIVYYQKPYSWRTLIEDKKILAIIKGWKAFVCSRKKEIYELEFISVLPFQRHKIIYEINRFSISILLKLLISVRNIISGSSDIVLWFFHPSANFFLQRLPKYTLIYDIVDYLEEIDDEKDDLSKMEEKMMLEADYVFANSLMLAEVKRNKHNRIDVVPCGCAVDLFPEGYKPLETPEILKGIKRPLIGYFGHLDYRLDYSLINFLASELPEYSFVFIGKKLEKKPVQPLQSETVKDISNKLTNIYMLPEIPKEKLRNVLPFFSLIFMPYKMEYQVVKYGNPMKFYESMAMNLPVVSVPIGSLLQYQNPWVRFAENEADFLKEIKLIVEKRKDVRIITGLRKIAEENSWQNKIKKIRQISKI